MMTTVYMIIAITLTTFVAAFPQNCLQYCKSLNNKTVILPECECSLYNTQSSNPTTLNLATPTPIKDNEIYYEPVEPNSFQKTHFDDQTLSMLHFNINLHSSTHSDTDSNKHLRTTEHEIEKARKLPLHLYLDLDLNTTGNSNILQLENLKKMFMNFHAAEKDLSECINLNIYIFSKRIDISGEADSQQLTEIQNKCNLTASLIKESIYQIQQPLSQSPQHTYEEDTYGANFSDDITHSPSSYMDSITTTDVYLRTHDTEITEAVYEKPTKTTKTSADIDYALNLPENIHKTQYNTEKIATDTYRPVITEGEVKIARILTKELSNGSLFSAVDGYEHLTNTDFETTTVATTDTNPEIKMSNYHPISNDSNVDDKVEVFQSGLIELHGRLYFSFGSIQIPARFIQHSDGELDVAIDALSMCSQMLEENSSNFMNLLCKSIKLQNLN